MDALQAKNLFFTYGAKPILDDISLTLGIGEIAALVGPSGIGKTTLLKVLASILPPSKGSVERTGSLTYMDQEDLLLPWRTVLENTLLPKEFKKRSRIEREQLKERAELLLHRFGLANWLHSYPEALSGGMKKITSLVRALVSDCDILLLDEPFSSIDLSIREKLFSLIQECAAQEKKAILFVTHDFRDAASLSDRICILAKGKIVEEIQIAMPSKGSLKLQGEILEKIRKSHSIYHPLLLP
jgi:ABC-type nitrate/sulfonate/bicarbonate transport system ATPase subunit